MELDYDHVDRTKLNMQLIDYDVLIMLYMICVGSGKPKGAA